MVRVAMRSKTHKEWHTFILIVDSGASYTALPRIDAEPLGVVIRDGTRMDVSGVGGESITAWLHTVTSEIGAMRLRLPVLFLERDDAPRVLGRAGLLRDFGVILDGVGQRTNFVHKTSPRYKAIQSLFNEV
ncbi:aspartyl protease family protein [Candidatus Uhrbacteria bacterium]|nr:aspartyl protease family protein [Candidatus Uhrbacteria bacterium]